MSIHGILGESTSYPTTYSPKVLYPIARSIGRDNILEKSGVEADVVCIGMDWWHCFELSWLNKNGISQVAMVRLAIPADSEFISESKSLKLYLNSLNFTEFDSSESVCQIIESDLSELLKTTVKAGVFTVQDKASLVIEQAGGINIDNALDRSLDKVSRKLALVDDVNASLLKAAELLNKESNRGVVQSYHSHLLRSNCPVTNQPDWGTLQIDITSTKIDEASLLEYILTYRQHNGFHEQCVEQVFADLTKIFSPSSLMVRAWYTRRGGIDINPCRVSDMALLPLPSRLSRQ